MAIPFNFAAGTRWTRTSKLTHGILKESIFSKFPTQRRSPYLMGILEYFDVHSTKIGNWKAPSFKKMEFPFFFSGSWIPNFKLTLPMQLLVTPSCSTVKSLNWTVPVGSRLAGKIKLKDYIYEILVMRLITRTHLVRREENIGIPRKCCDYICLH